MIWTKADLQLFLCTESSILALGGQQRIITACPELVFSAAVKWLNRAVGMNTELSVPSIIAGTDNAVCTSVTF